MNDYRASNKIQRFEQRCLIALFIVVISVPFFLFFFHTSDSLAIAEKRTKAPLPTFSVQSWLKADYQKKLEQYLDDRFGLRDELVRYNALLHIKALRTSPVSTVLAGKNGWLFYAGEKAIDDYRSLDPFTGEELQAIASGLNTVQQEMDRRGITFVVFITPDKHTMYPEFLPRGVRRVNPQSRFDQVTEFLQNHSKVTVIDPRSALIAAKETQRIYHVTDSHWNAYGAFVAYQELVKTIGKKRSDVAPLSPDDFFVRNEVQNGGDLAEALSIQTLMSENSIQLEPKLKSRATEVAVHISGVSFEKPSFGYMRESPELPSALIFRDSFSIPLVPYLAETFKRTVFVKTDDIVWEAIDQENPDIVILELAERYLGKLLESDPYVDFSS